MNRENAGRGVSRRTFVSMAAAGAAGTLFAPAIIGRAQAATVVKLGHTQPLTGPSAAYGIRGRDGALLAVKHINDAGGFADQKGNKYTLAMTEDDMVNDPKQAATLFRQHAIDPQIVASLGPTNSVGFLPVIPVAGQLKLPLIGNGSGAPVKQWNPWAYRVNTVAATAVPAMLKVVVKVAGIKRLGIMYDQTQDAQSGDARIARDIAGELGYEVVAFEAFRAGDQDFSPQIAKVKGGKPDAIYIAAATGDGVKVVSQVRTGGLDQPLITGYGSFRDPVYWDGTGGKVQGGYTWAALDFSTATGKLKEWETEYNKAFKLEATEFSTYGYNSVWTVVECIKRTNGTDRNKIQEALANLAFTTPIGTKVTFKNPPHGDNLTPAVVVLQVTGRGQAKAVAG
ncbi:MAG: ABC transporter substrate-binding protein [Proteobacteria bacterium]|nr:ABC transporter substrate-binding protein [Pseudomonadota bacterium]